MASALPADVQAALATGQKLDAIRLLREQTGMGLAEAKAAVEAGELPAEEVPQVDAAARALPAEAAAALQEGRMIDAIRLVRERYRVGLKEAKDIVDAARPDRHEGPREPRGLWVGLALLLLVVAAIWLYLARA